MHSVKSQSNIFFLSTQALNNLKSPPSQTKDHDNSNILHMFNNNSYTDFTTLYKHILIPGYVIQVI